MFENNFGKCSLLSFYIHNPAQKMWKRKNSQAQHISCVKILSTDSAKSLRLLNTSLLVKRSEVEKTNRWKLSLLRWKRICISFLSWSNKRSWTLSLCWMKAYQSWTTDQDRAFTNTWHKCQLCKFLLQDEFMDPWSLYVFLWEAMLCDVVLADSFSISS